MSLRLLKVIVRIIPLLHPRGDFPLFPFRKYLQGHRIMPGRKCQSSPTALSDSRSCQPFRMTYSICRPAASHLPTLGHMRSPLLTPRPLWRRSKAHFTRECHFCFTHPAPPDDLQLLWPIKPHGDLAPGRSGRCSCMAGPGRGAVARRLTPVTRPNQVTWPTGHVRQR